MNPAEPLVSVLMTAYNRQEYIGEAIDSVLHSGYRHFELIIVDDASADETVNIVRSYLDKDPRLQLHINETNLGDYPNRNRAVSFAKGRYIMFCDSDDLFFQNSISYCVNAMESFPAAKAGLYYPHGGTGPFIMDKQALIKEHFFEKAVLNIGPGGSIIDREFFISIGGYPEAYGPANDMYFNLKLFSKTDILFLPRLFLHYRVHAGQEKNNTYAYIYNNYRYLSDALAQIDLGLQAQELQYLANKNNRRFITNCFNYFLQTKSITAAARLWKKAGFSFKKLLSGVFHK